MPNAPLAEEWVDGLEWHALRSATSVMEDGFATPSESLVACHPSWKIPTFG